MGKFLSMQTCLIEIPMQLELCGDAESLMRMPAATRSVGHSQANTHTHTHYPRRTRILANLSQITVEHAHAPAGAAGAGAGDGAAGTGDRTHWRNINSHFRDFNCPLACATCSTYFRIPPPLSIPLLCSDYAIVLM